DGHAREADAHTVFDHVGAFRQIDQRDLVSQRDRLDDDDLHAPVAIRIDGGVHARRDVADGDGDRVARVVDGESGSVLGLIVRVGRLRGRLHNIAHLTSRTAQDVDCSTWSYNGVWCQCRQV